MKENEEKEKGIVRIRAQLIEWCNSLRGDIEDYFAGNYIRLNAKIKAMSELNGVDVALMRRFVFLWWASEKTKDADEKKAVSGEIWALCERIYDEVMKRKSKKLFSFRLK